MGTSIAQVTISVQVSGAKTWTYTLPNASSTNPPQFATSPAADQQVTFAAAGSRTTIPVPTGALYAVIIPPTTSVVSKTYDASGAVGGALHPSNPSVIGFPSGTSNIYVTADSAETAEILFL